MKQKGFLMLMLFVLLFQGIPVFATSTSVEFAVPVQNVVTGDRPDAMERFRFTITSDTAPLPSNAELTLCGTAQGEFDAIVYQKPGIYSYTIRQVSGDCAGYTHVKPLYDVTVCVVTNADRELSIASVVVENQATGKKVDAIRFEHIYTAPKQPSPSTGDQSTVFAWGMLALAALTVMIALVLYEKNETRGANIDSLIVMHHRCGGITLLRDYHKIVK